MDRKEIIEKYQFETDRNYSCTWNARVAYEALKDLGIRAEIHWVEEKPHDDFSEGHAFVVAIKQNSTDLALNSPFWSTKWQLTVAEVKKRGVVFTKEILKEPWKRLM